MAVTYAILLQRKNKQTRLSASSADMTMEKDIDLAHFHHLESRSRQTLVLRYGNVC